MNIDTQREAEIFDEARLHVDPAARRSFLQRACEGDAAQIARLEGLIEAERDAETFFAESGSAAHLSAIQRLVAQSEAEAHERQAGTVPGEEPLGTRIGRYKLCEKIGEGGWGIVYMAEQEEPVRRRVALKIIKLGMETKSVIARFEAERQALAMMDHPNIARVFDAGATDRGPPYFVMELVQGVRITSYCDQHKLGIEERLDLFIQVCHAIQHAHQKGIIHGDIKPSNILVARSDPDAPGVPKIIDFGIAKATEARLTDRMLFTPFAQLLGTPAYMSPEQADMNRTDTDTRSDIYSLGVLLYELLTGTTPFDAKQLLESGIDELRRTLRETEPPRPSARMAALPAEELERTAAARRADAHRLIHVIRGDLDWIVMKALEKDRGRRYETANGFASDVLHHLNNEPVLARPPSRLYRFRKLVRRNRAVFAAIGGILTALVLGLGTSTWLFLRERQAHQRAVAAEQQQARLRHEAEVREKISLAALLVSQERFDEADKLLGDIPFDQSSVEGASVLRAVAEWHAVRMQWKLAADRFGQLLEVNRIDSSDVSSLDFLRAGPVMIELGDTIGYERFRQSAITRFTVAPCPFSDRIVKISLLLPANDRIIDSLRPLAEETAKYIAEADQSGDDFTAAWRSVSLGLHEYRRGDFRKAAEWSQRCLAYPGVNAPRTATARIILAMSYHRFGRDAEARAEFETASEIIESKFRQKPDAGGPVQGFWFDWGFARVLLRECNALLETSPRRL
jgi:serine/threonine protein kinase